MVGVMVVMVVCQLTLIEYSLGASLLSVLPVCLYTGLLQQSCEPLRSYATCPRPPVSKGRHPDVSPGRLADQQLLVAMATCHFQLQLPPSGTGRFLPRLLDPAQGQVHESDLPEQGLRFGVAPASLSKWYPRSSALSTSSVKGKNCPPGRPPERQGTITHTVAVDVSRGRSHFLNQEARKKRRFYSEPCLWDLGGGGCRQKARVSWMDALYKPPLWLPLHRPLGGGCSSPTHC